MVWVKAPSQTALIVCVSCEIISWAHRVSAEHSDLVSTISSGKIQRYLSEHVNQQSALSYDAPSTSCPGRRMLSLWRWIYGFRIRVCLQNLIRGWRDTRTSSVDTSPIQTLSKHCMSTVNRNRNNGTPRSLHLTITPSAVNNILSLWAASFLCELWFWEM